MAVPPGLLDLRRCGPGTTLPAPVLQRMEGLFGADFSRVRIHQGREAVALGAVAFTHGERIFFAPSHYNPTSPAGQRLLAHELAHVVQQRSGRVRNPFGPTLAMVHDQTLEAEAERAARTLGRMPGGAVQAKAAGGSRSGHRRPAGPRPGSRPPHSPRRSGVVQRAICLLEDNLGDFDLWHQIYNMLKKHPSEDVFILERAAGKIRSGDRLAIVGHGNTSKIGRWYSPNILANTLGTLDLPSNLKRIELLTCMSGYGDAGSYAAKLSHQLSYRFAVRGYRGTNFTTPEGKNRAELPEEERSVPEMLDQYFTELYPQWKSELDKLGVTGAGLDPILLAIGLSRDTLASMEIGAAAELVLQKLMSLSPDLEEQYIQDLEQEEKFKIWFENVVEEARTCPPEDFKGLLIKAVEKRFGSTEGGGSTARRINPKGRVTFARDTGEMTIKTHKEYLELH